MKVILLNLSVVIISLMVSWYILVGLSCIGDKYQIPYLNSWSMMHVTIFFLFPVVAVIVFVSIRKVFNLIFLKQKALGDKVVCTTSSYFWLVVSIYFAYVMLRLGLAIKTGKL